MDWIQDTSLKTERFCTMVDSNAEPSKIEPTRFDSQTQIYQGNDNTVEGGVEGIFFSL